MNKLYAILFLTLLLCNNIYGQRWISGQVRCVCYNEPVSDVFVRDIRRNEGVHTDIDGNYRIKIDSLDRVLDFFDFVTRDSWSEIIRNDSIVNAFTNRGVILNEFVINAFRDVAYARRPLHTVRFETISTRRRMQNFRIQRETISRSTIETNIGTRISYEKTNTRLISRRFISREVISSTGPTINEANEHQLQRFRESLMVDRQFAGRTFGELQTFIVSSIAPYLQNINYPELAIKHHIQGRTMISFIVDADGNITNVRTIRGVDPLLDREVVSALQSASVCREQYRRFFYWERSQPGRVCFVLPVCFRLYNVSAERLEYLRQNQQ